MGDGGEKLAVGLPGPALAAHLLDQRAAHFVHGAGQGTDLILPGSADVFFQLAGADLPGGFGQGDDPAGQPVHIEQQKQNEAAACHRHRRRIHKQAFPNLRIVHNGDEIHPVRKAQGIEPAIPGGIIDDLIVRADGLAAGEAAVAATAVIEQNGHIVVFRRPLGQSVGVLAGNFIPGHIAAEAGIDLRLALGHVLLTHIDRVDQHLAQGAHRKVQYGAQQYPQQGYIQHFGVERTGQL